MRLSYWLVVGAILVAAIALAYWPSARTAASASPPGQYPLEHHNGHEWPATPSVGMYRPRGSGMQDAISSSGAIDAKMSCGGDRGSGRSCTLPTVPLGPQYTPTLLQD